MGAFQEEIKPIRCSSTYGVMVGMVALLERCMDMRHSSLKVDADGFFWRQKAGAGSFFDEPAFLVPAGFFFMSRLFEKADQLFGDESWEQNNGTRSPASHLAFRGASWLMHA